MTNAELDLLWAQATVEAIENGEMYTRHRFAAAVLSRQLAEIERLRAELEALRKQEPVAWMNVRNGFICKKPTNADYQQPLYLAAGAQPAPSVPDCPYPCGWKNLLTIALQDGAFLARAVEAGEVVTESIRATTMKVVLNLREVLLAINKAPEATQPAPSMPGRATMIERLKAAVEGECDGLAVDDRHAEAILDYVLAAAPKAPKRGPLTVDCIGLALDLETQAKRVESQTTERAMLAAADGLRIIAAAPEVPKRKPLTDAMVEAAGRALSDRHANGCGCGMDKDIMWGSYSDEFEEQARVALEAAHASKESGND